MKRFELAILAMIVWAPTGVALAERAPLQVTVTVDTSNPGSVIDPSIYGQVAEHEPRTVYDGIWVGPGSAIPNIRGYRKDVLEALKKIHVPVVRWPGGCFADQYDWRDGIGPPDQRPLRLNMWGGSETNAFGTHEFLDFVELLGAEAYVSGNMGSMDARAMGQWLEYMTSTEKSALTDERRRNGRDQPWHVKYFGLGNEVWGCGGMMRAEYAVDVTRRYSYFLNPFPGQDKLIKVASGPTANLPGYEAFTETMMKDAKTLFGNFAFQALSLHYYTYSSGENLELADKDRPPPTPATGFSEDKWAGFLRAALQIDPIIVAVSRIMDRYDPEKKVGLYVDEWGTTHKWGPGLFQQNTLLDAEIAALHFNVFQRHSDRVKMADLANFVNAEQALILTQGGIMVLTPTYHVFDMYQPFQGATPYPATVSSIRYNYEGRDLPAVDVSAARGKDGKLYLALVNLDPHRSADVVTNLTGLARGTLLTGPAMDTHNTFEAPDTLRPVAFAGSNKSGKVVLQLPAKSVAVVAIQ
jgi:alpha-L-arabinofuranosidase